MESEAAEAWEQRLKKLFDAIDDTLEDRYGRLFKIHPSRPKRGSTASKEQDGLFNVGASFSAGFGSDLGRGYVVDFDIATLDSVPVATREQIKRDVFDLVSKKLPGYFPDTRLRIGRDGNTIKIFGDTFRLTDGATNVEHKLAKYLKVLRIELEDLEEDLEMMKVLYDQRGARAEITDYVVLENVSLLKSEIAGVASLIKTIDDIPVEKFGSLGEFVDYIDTLFRERTEHAGYPESVYALVKRKLRKVSKYILSTDS